MPRAIETSQIGPGAIGRPPVSSMLFSANAVVTSCFELNRLFRGKRSQWGSILCSAISADFPLQMRSRQQESFFVPNSEQHRSIATNFQETQFFPYGHVRDDSPNFVLKTRGQLLRRLRTDQDGGLIR